MILIAAAIAAAAQQPETTTRRGGSVEIHPAIARAIQPYMQCKVARTSADGRLPTGDPAVLRAIGADAGTACADIRRQGFEAADAALRGDARYPDQAARHALIERTFTQIDGMYDALIANLPSNSNAPRN